MSSRISSMIAALLGLALLSACGTSALSPSAQPSSATGEGTGPSTAATSGPELSPAPVQPDTAGAKAEVSDLYSFISSKMTGSYGVFTNLQDTSQSGEAATGHETLSESASLLMRYAVLTGNKELFTEQWKLAKDTFDMTGGFSYRYSPKLNKRYPVNAAVDDLRIIRALDEAGERFSDAGLTAEAERYGLRFYENNIKNGNMYDFYDEDYKVTNKFVTLCYIDLQTLQKLPVAGEKRNQLLEQMQSIVQGGYLSDQFPFYESRFDYESGKYDSANINTVESLLTILSLTEAGLQQPPSIAYIKQQVEAGTLYGQYTRTGEPTNDIRSTAIYAITAMIGAEAGDEALYRRSIERMNEFRISDPASGLYGGFGDVARQQAYSFDNLMALLAYSYSN